MNEPFDERDPVEELAEEFASRCRKGEHPSVREYARSNPQYAERIERLFPVIAMMEQSCGAERSGPPSPSSLLQKLVYKPDRVGDFHIVQEIGRGGMGIVYEAEQQSLGRRVAVKILPKQVLFVENQLKRFQREAQTAASLHHTNIVPVFGVGQQDGLHYYVMQLIRGVGLDEVIREMRAEADARQGQSGQVANGNGRSATSFLDAVRVLTSQKYGDSSGRDGGESVSGGEDHMTDAPGSPPTTIEKRLSTRRGRPAELSRHEPPCELGKQPTKRFSLRLDSLQGDYWTMVARVGVQAAAALEFAHQHGVLHRDIKPANLIVNDQGAVWVADFGVARAVDGPDVSRTGDIVGTLRYMAPEQLCGGDTDTRSDIYSLGATLYELATLRPAVNETARNASLRGQRVSREPPAPRKLAPGMPRDLETVILTCLAEDPGKRYASAGALEADMQRFPRDQPVRARRISPIERTYRWCRRNPALAGMTTVASILLAAMILTAAVGYVKTSLAYAQTRAALDQADMTSKVALAALDRIYRQLSPERTQLSIAQYLEDNPETEELLEGRLTRFQLSKENAALLESLLVFYDRFAAQVHDDTEVQLQSAVASRRLGDIRELLGQSAIAEHEYWRAVKKLEDLKTRQRNNVAVRLELARSYNGMANCRATRLLPHRRFHEEALTILRLMKDAGPRTREHQYETARTYYFLASEGRGRGRSREYRQSAIALLERLNQRYRQDPEIEFLLALCHRISEGSRENRDEGRRQAVGIMERLVADNPDVSEYRYELARTRSMVLSLYDVMRDLEGRRDSDFDAASAEQQLLKALDESQWLITYNPTVPRNLRRNTLILAKLATVYRRTHRTAEAERGFRKALEQQTSLIQEFPDLPSHNQPIREFLRLCVAQMILDRTADLADRSAVAEARGLLETCVENLVPLRQNPELARSYVARTSLRRAYDTLSRLYAAAGEAEKAAEAERNRDALAERSFQQRTDDEPSSRFRDSSRRRSSPSRSPAEESPVAPDGAEGSDDSSVPAASRPG